MKQQIIVFLFCAFASYALSQLSDNDFHSRGWKMSDRMEQILMRNAEIEVGFAVRQRNREQLQELFEKVSDPKSPQYGKYLSLQELTDLVSSSQEDKELVEGWFQENGATEYKWVPTGDFVTLRVPVQIASKMFGTSFRAFEEVAVPHRKILRCKSYTLPSKLEGVFDKVIGITGFPHLVKVDSIAHHSDVAESVTPTVVRDQYSIPSPDQSAVNPSNPGQAVAEFGEGFSPDDLQTFWKKFDPSQEGQAVSTVYGGNKPKLAGIEANLDIQYIMAIGSFVNTSVYNYFGGGSIESDLLTWANQLASESNPPLVHSVSYGAYGGTYPSEEVHRLDADFQKLGVRGLTILFASGDNGVGCNVRCNSFEPDFPSSSYITMVGSTQLDRSSGKETAASFSSGGFANIWSRPSYQNESVSAFLNQNDLPASSWYNASGRGYPDVSTLGVNVQIINRGEVTPVDGTSCSSPILAGMISLLNDMRLNAGKSPLGFFNPVMYSWASNAGAFNDITSGNNGKACCPGFDAVPGWDAVTGLGTPNFDVWTTLVKQLP